LRRSVVRATPPTLSLDELQQRVLLPSV
jgi:hypothetical protein